MVDSTDLVLESFLETQLKLKILHSTNNLYSKDSKSLSEIKKKYYKIVFKSLIFNPFKKGTFF